MINISIRVTRQIAGIPQNVLTVKYALDPLVVSLLGPEPSNFSHFTYWSERGGFGDVHNTVPLGPRGGEWEQFILTINPEDARNKLINSDGDNKKVYWYRDNKLVFGNMIPGSVQNPLYKNKVRVKTNLDGSIKTTRMRLKPPAYPKGQYVDMDMVEVDGFKKSDKNKTAEQMRSEGIAGWFTEISGNWKVYKALGGYPDLTCVYWGDEFPPVNGVSYLPIAYFEGYGLTV